jgi:hypothetical protein
MNGKRHPLTGATYQAQDDGNVFVVAKSGATGVFTTEGRWLEGELRSADPHLCGWVAGPRVPDPAKAGVSGSTAADAAAQGRA